MTESNLTVLTHKLDVTDLVSVLQLLFNHGFSEVGPLRSFPPPHLSLIFKPRWELCSSAAERIDLGFSATPLFINAEKSYSTNDFTRKKLEYNNARLLEEASLICQNDVSLPVN